MATFLQSRVDRLVPVLTESSATLGRFSSGVAWSGDEAVTVLASAAATYQSLGMPLSENVVRAQLADLTTALHGIHPGTGERVVTRRRDLVRGCTLAALRTTSARLRDDIAADEGVLSDARALLRPIVLQALPRGLLGAALPADPDQAYLEQVWAAVKADPDLTVAAAQVALLVSGPDILVILGELFRQLG